MTRLFVSYARSDRDRIEELIASLREVGVQTWHDSELKGGQAWWDEILAAIAQCDVFLAMISPNYIKSKACQVERSYASALNRHLMPVKVADYPVQVLPIDLQGKQIIDYTTSNDRAAFKLIGRRAPSLAGPRHSGKLPALARRGATGVAASNVVAGDRDGLGSHRRPRLRRFPAPGCFA